PLAPSLRRGTFPRSLACPRRTTPPAPGTAPPAAPRPGLAQPAPANRHRSRPALRGPLRSLTLPARPPTPPARPWTMVWPIVPVARQTDDPTGRPWEWIPDYCLP